LKSWTNSSLLSKQRHLSRSHRKAERTASVK
jgi:hypothetical protein